MKVSSTRLEGVRLIQLQVFPDLRGSFVETWNRSRYRDAGIDDDFLQDNLSMSRRSVLRGLHFQASPHAQAKLVTVLSGEVYDVIVDLREESPSFGQWEAHTLSAGSGLQLYVPAGFAHGFAVTSDIALVAYKCDAPHHPASERTLLWSDPTLQIDWPVGDPILSEKDRSGSTLEQLFPRRPSATG